MKTDNARNLLLIITVVLIELSSEDKEGDKTEEESLEEDDFNPFKFDKDDGLGPINEKGKLRKHFAMDTALLNPSDNVVCSPEAALFPLGHLALGAHGSCLEEIFLAIGLASKSQIPIVFGALIGSLKDIQGVNITVVSKIFISNDIKLKKKFVDRTQTIFQSTVSKVNFASPGKVADSVNKYISSKTGGKIKELLQPDEVQQNSSMILINVMCFAGNWKYHFTHAKSAIFHTQQGPKKTVMLTRAGFYQYHKSEQLHAKFIEIPYKGDQASLLIVLPDPGLPLGALLEHLRNKPKDMQKAIENMVSEDIILSIPKFSIEAQLDLKKSFTELGVKQMFNTSKSGLDAIAESKQQKVHVSMAIHRALIDVDDHGGAKHLEPVVNQEQVLAEDPSRTVELNYPFLFFVKFLNEALMAGVFAQID